ncbi:hypothetical protein PIB30_057830 [Stylosanthes scabra]|uniref:NAD(P)H dehydrogenase (quinone) n=1 Tax=Stylosanthes scabra TaxID=79078 RepID=A0ABU6TJL7_9FABA|nr:hypothetical protein [Stylosanthes scabra]
MDSYATMSKPVIKVAALCGSLRKASFNRGLIRAAIEVSKKQITGLHVEFIDTSSLPMLNTDLEENGRFPAEVEEFRQKILESDCCFFASPDYNYSVTPLLKNALRVGRKGSRSCIGMRRRRKSAVPSPANRSVP